MSGQESRELQEARAEIARLKEQLRQRDDLIRQTFGRYLTGGW